MAQNDLQEQSSKEYNLRSETTSIEDSLAKLNDYGGFNFASNLIAGGLINLDPEQPARRNIFLKDEKKKEERRKIKKQLQQLVDVLKTEGDAAHLFSMIEEEKATVKDNYNENMIEILKKSRNLEKSFRSIALFYKNSGEQLLKNVEFLNIRYEDIKSEDSTAREEIQQRFNDAYRSVDMKDSYSLLLIPGYMGSKTAIEGWAKVCYDNKVTLITDYTNLESWKEEDIKVEDTSNANVEREAFLGSTKKEDNQLAGQTNHMANAIVVANEIVARDGYSEVGEKLPLYVGGAGALAGRLLSNNPAQPVAGVKYGTLFDAKGVRFNLTRDHITELHDKCLVPLTMYEGSVIAFGDQSLNKGGDIDFNKYSVVRVYNFISKCLTHYFNSITYEKWDLNKQRKVNDEIVKFLDNLKFEAQIIKDFRVDKIQQDKAKPDVINFELSITPFYPARSFVFTLNRLEDKTLDEGRTIK